MTRHGAVAIAAVAFACACAAQLDAQSEQPVVFVHGLFADDGSWSAAAERLQTSVTITPYVPNPDEGATFEQQAGQLQQADGSLGPSTIAIGHSNGGLVSRQWSRTHDLAGLVTIGTPHQGVPLLQNVYGYTNFNVALLDSIVELFGTFQVGCCDWIWILSNIQDLVGLAGNMAHASVAEVAADLGLDLAHPVIPEMFAGSSFLAGINASDNVTREGNAIAGRVGIVSVAHNFYWGGPLRAAWPDQGDLLASYRDAAVAAMQFYASYIEANASIDDLYASELADLLWRTSALLSEMDEWWCEAVSWPGMGSCWYNDTVVPVWSQDYSAFGALPIYVLDGPAHLQETRESDEWLYDVLTTEMSVPPRAAPAPPSPSTEVTFFDSTQYTGSSFPAAGDSSFVGSDWNDRISSIRIAAGKTLVLYQDRDFSGACLTITGDQVDLRQYAGPGPDGTWNDVVSSFRVYDGPAPAVAAAATFFTDADFLGDSFSADADLPFVGWDWNDRVSSVTVPPGKTVTLYEHKDFDGASLTLTEGEGDLRRYMGPGPDGTWNDSVSSLRLYDGAASPAPPPADSPAPPAMDAPVFSEHVEFGGASFSTGADMSFVGWEWNDRISSIKVPPGTTVVVYEHVDFGGSSLTLTGEEGDLRRYPGPGDDGTWNDAISSIRVY